MWRLLPLFIAPQMLSPLHLPSLVGLRQNSMQQVAREDQVAAGKRMRHPGPFREVWGTGCLLQNHSGAASPAVAALFLLLLLLLLWAGEEQHAAQARVHQLIGAQALCAWGRAEAVSWLR